MSNYKDLKNNKFSTDTSDFSDITDTGTEGTKVAVGTTAQRGTTQGQFRFNTTTGLAEYYDGTSFKSIDTAPTISEINPTSLGQSVLGSSQSIVITGTDFSGVVTVKIVGNDGTEFDPASTTRNSATQITITTPTNLTHTNEPYDIKVINSSNLSGSLVNCLSINDTPVFSTGAGSLGTLADGGRAASNLTPIAFTDEESTPTVSVTTGSIPAGLTLNSNGTFSGTANAVSSNATSNFTVTATDGSETATRDYSITVNAPVITFATSAGSIGTINDADRGSYSLSAVTATVTSGTLSYAIQSGSLPGSLSLNTSTGAISGTLDAVTSDTTSTFTIRATTTSASVTADREFTITVNAPLVLSVSGNIYNGVASNLTITCTNTDGTVDIVFKEGGTTHSTLSNQSLSGNSKTVAVPSAVYNQSTGDTISITVVDGSKTSNAITRTILGVPTGGSISSSGGYRIHTFTSSGTFTIPSGLSLATEYVVVAGGAGVGSRRHSGGGGAGGYRSSVSGESSGRGASAESAPTKGAGSYTVTIGGGGSSASSSSNSNSGANNGSNSVFDNITSNGGGYGGTYNTGGNSGGAGGGSGSEGGTSTSGGSGTSNQGYNGGDGQNNAGGGVGGGGGGAGANGNNGTSGQGGHGGAGVASSITGSSVTRAGGGGGGGGTSSSSGNAGSGGGGNGANSGGSPSSGSSNTGGGAGGGGSDGRSNPTGGSGIVIVRYQL